MANANGWGDGSVNNNIGWGQGSNNTIGWGKSQLDSWSGATDIDGGNLPSNSVAPAITGTAQEGQTLTCSTGTWSGSPTYTYQWKRNGNNITSATNSTYLLVTADVGQSIKCTVTATNFVGNATADSNTVTPTSSVDADAQAFITAASITDPTQQSAINQLVVDLKGYGVWTKMKALYPMVGGSSTSHSYNLRNTAQYQITWSGGVTHSSTGAKFGGVNGFGNTNLNGLSVLNQDSTHLSFYSRTQSNGTEVEIGAAAPSNGSLIEIRTAGTTYFRVNSAASYLTYSDADSRAFYLVNRTASNVVNGWRNSTKVATGTTASSSLYNFNLFLGALNENGNAIYYTTKECAFASIGDGLSDTEASNFYTAVQTFQTTLGRQVGTPIPLTGTLLNDYPDAAAAYSLRKLRTAYTGDAIRVRRSSDNTEQNIGFVNNVLDTASLLTFCGAGNGFVTTWYDQSGNARDITQSTAANQPQIVSSGSVLVHNSKPAMTFDGTNDAFSRDLSGFATTTQFYVLNTSDTQYLYPHFSSFRYGWVAQQGSSSSGAPSSYGTPSLYVNSSLFTGTTRNDVYNSLNGYKAVCHQAADSFALWQFGDYGGFNVACNLQEFVYYGSNQSANRAGIFSNINTFYSIY